MVLLCGEIQGRELDLGQSRVFLVPFCSDPLHVHGGEDACVLHLYLNIICEAKSNDKKNGKNFCNRYDKELISYLYGC